jgi:hypothetical protein
MSVTVGTCLQSRYPETALVCPPISRFLHSNGSTGYNIAHLHAFKRKTEATRYRRGEPNHGETQFSLQVWVVVPKLKRQMRWGIKGRFVQLDIPAVETGHTAETTKGVVRISCLPHSIRVWTDFNVSMKLKLWKIGIPYVTSDLITPSFYIFTYYFWNINENFITIIVYGRAWRHALTKHGLSVLGQPM